MTDGKKRRRQEMKGSIATWQEEAERPVMLEGFQALKQLRGGNNERQGSKLHRRKENQGKRRVRNISLKKALLHQWRIKEDRAKEIK